MDQGGEAAAECLWRSLQQAVTTPEVEDREERGEEERWRREGIAEAWWQLQVCLPSELRNSL